MLIVQVYAETISSMKKSMAMEVIRKDLENDSGTPVELNYFSLARAISRFNKKPKPKSKQANDKPYFPDAYELKNDQLPPGRFKVS